MEPTPIEPLDPATWFRRAERLLDVAEKYDGESPDTAIRMAYHLIALAPGPLRDFFPAKIDEAAIEAMLDCGGYESAVMTLMGHNVAFKAEKKLNSDTIEVSMSLDRQSINGKGRHEMCAVAMIKAWAACLINLGKTARALNQADRDPRISPYGSPRGLTEH